MSALQNPCTGGEQSVAPHFSLLAFDNLSYQTLRLAMSGLLAQKHQQFWWLQQKKLLMLAKTIEKYQLCLDRRTFVVTIDPVSLQSLAPGARVVCGCRISCGTAQHSARTQLGDLSCAAAKTTKKNKARPSNLGEIAWGRSEINKRGKTLQELTDPNLGLLFLPFSPRNHPFNRKGIVGSCSVVTQLWW